MTKTTSSKRNGYEGGTKAIKERPASGRKGPITNKEAQKVTAEKMK
jgi:hypothetical protein